MTAPVVPIDALDAFFGETAPVEHDLAAEFPAELKKLSNWLLWKLQPDGDGRKTKVPYQALARNGKYPHASSTNPETWSLYEQACRVVKQLGADKGIGFALGENGCGYLFLDLDGCRNAKTGQIALWAAEIYQKFPTYTEITPSGEGLRMIYRYAGTEPPALPNGGGILKIPMPKLEDVQKSPALEIFVHSKYVAVTGDRLPDITAEIAPCEELLAALQQRWEALQRDSPPADQAGEIVQHNYSRTRKFKLLAAGRWHEVKIDGKQLYPSRSEAVSAFVLLLAYKFGNNAEAIDKAFRASGMYKVWSDKWGRRGKDEIKRAIRFAAQHPPETDPEENSAKTEDEQPRLKILALTDVEVKPINWLWKDRLAFGKLATLAGHMGTGKTTVALDVIARATTSRDFPDAENSHPPCNALILSAEDDPGDTLKPRLLAAGADPKRVGIVQSVLRLQPNGGELTVEDMAVALDQDCQLLRDEVARNREIRIILVDPLTSYLGRAKFTDEQQVRRVLGPLKALAEEFELLMLFVTHFNKDESLGANQRSIVAGLDKMCRAVWGFADSPEDGEDVRAMVPIRLSNAKESGRGLLFRLAEGMVTDLATSKVEWIGATDRTMDELLKPNEASDKEREAIRFLFLFLVERNGRALARDIYEAAEKAGVDKKVLHVSREYLGIHATKGLHGRYIWTVKPPRKSSDQTPPEAARGPENQDPRALEFPKNS